MSKKTRLGRGTHQITDLKISVEEDALTKVWMEKYKNRSRATAIRDMILFAAAKDKIKVKK